MTITSTDRIEREVLLKAPVSRVWNALSDAEAFGDWFGVDFKGQTFVPGQTARGDKLSSCGSTKGGTCELAIETVQPESLIAMRWYPYSEAPAGDRSGEPTTRIEFTLAEAEGGTLLRVVESGFDDVPGDRRDLAFRMHSGGWDQQMENIANYLDAA